MTKTIASRLESLGLVLPNPPAIPGSYKAIIKHQGVITVSGQVPLVDGQVEKTGHLGRDVTIEEGQRAARVCLMNALSQLNVAAGGLDNVKGFIRMAGYVAADPAFTQHGAVVEAASETLMRIFGEVGDHARCALGVASLPRGVPVEIELSAFVD